MSHGLGKPDHLDLKMLKGMGTIAALPQLSPSPFNLELIRSPSLPSSDRLAEVAQNDIWLPVKLRIYKFN